MVRDINPVETDDSFYSFFIHVMIMQALSDDELLSSMRQEVTAQPVAGVRTARFHVFPL